METIKVNMSPNPLDVQTIHASQNDGEARQWGFELHNNGDVIDASEISDQLVFKAYKGGTEQLLPENGSTPTTSPIIADIKYPQGLLTDQEFTYRQSPTEEDGLAKITDIKGNTIVWNQVAPSMSSSVWVANRCTKTVSGNTFSLVGTGATQSSFGVYISLPNFKLKVNHDYLFMCIVNTNRGTQIRFTFDRDIRYTTITPNKDNVYSRVVSTATEDPVVCYINHPSSITTSDTVTIKNLMIVDLTMLNDSRITDYDSFRTYYPLDYYSYNQSTLVSFNGNGLKTVGKNLLPKGTSTTNNGITWTVNEDGTVVANGTASADSQLAIPIKLPEGNYYFNGCPDGGNDSSTWNCYIWDATTGTRAKQWDRTSNVLNNTSSTQSRQFYSNGTDRYIFNCRVMRNQTVSNLVFKPMIRLSNADANYEPYTESALSIPLDEFPNGMDGVNDARDEKNETGYAKKIGQVDLGTLTYTYTQTSLRFEAQMPSNYKIPTSVSDRGNMICAKYSTNPNPLLGNGQEGITGYQNSNIVFISDQSTTDPAVFKTMMNGVVLYYELRTPLENYGVVDLGTLNWTYTNVEGHLRFVSGTISPEAKLPANNTIVNAVCTKYEIVTEGNVYNNQKVGLCIIANSRAMVYDSNYTDAQTFATAMSGVYLLYEKENPQGFATATLVTENGEIPLSNEDGVLIGKCTEQLSENPGFIDAKIKLSDADGECYSNKLQLHVERSPQ